MMRSEEGGLSDIDKAEVAGGLLQILILTVCGRS